MFANYGYILFVIAPARSLSSPADLLCLNGNQYTFRFVSEFSAPTIWFTSYTKWPFKINHPIIIIHDGRDEFFPVHIPVTIYQAIPQSQLCIIQNYQHGVPWEININLISTILLTILTKIPFDGSNK